MRPREAIELLKNMKWSITTKFNAVNNSTKALDMAITAMEKQEQDRWIPVTERLPDECEEVNITWINTEPAVYYEDIKNKPFTGTGLYNRGQWYWYSAVCKDYLEERGDSPCDEMDSAIKVTAWRPLPEPYEGRRDGNK